MACSTPRSSIRRCSAAKLKSFDDKSAAASERRAPDSHDRYVHAAAPLPAAGRHRRASPTTPGRRCRDARSSSPVWDNGPNAVYNSDQYKKELQETARKPGKVARNQRRRGRGVRPGRQDQSKLSTTSRTWRTLRWSHPSLSPTIATGKVSVWTSTQNPQAVQEIISQKLGIPKENGHLPRDRCSAAASAASRNRTTRPKRRCCRKRSASR